MINAMQIGYGYWGSNVANKLSMSPMINFKYLAEQDAKKREIASIRYPKVIIIDNYKDYLGDDIDAVFITTQTEYSFDIAMEAMNRGKHVFIEKPLAKNEELAEQLVQASRRNGIILHCDHLMVYNPVINHIKHMIDEGELGDLLYIDIVRANLGPIRKDINALLDLAVHDIAVSDYLLGGINPDIIQYIGTKTVGSKDTITYLTMKQKDILININSSWVSPVKIRRTLVAGSQKMCVFDDTLSDKLTVYDKGIDVVQGAEYGSYEYKIRTGDIHIPHINDEDSLMNSISHFCDCIKQNRQSLSGPEQSLRVMHVLECAKKMSGENNAKRI